jgi:putative ABC transport system substrate-binding protein
MRRIGVLAFSNPAAGRAYFAALAAELAKLGWVDGRNLQLIYRYADGDSARLPALAAELVALEPDALFSSNVPGSLALAHATSRIPIVMTGNYDPVAMGLVDSMARPGGNVTGIATSVDTAIHGKRLEFLKSWFPRMSRVAVIYNPEESNTRVAFLGLQDSAKRLGIGIEPLVARSLSEIRFVIDTLSKDRPDAVYLINTAASYRNRELICTEAARMRLPTMADWSQYPESGCLASYSYSAEDYLRECAEMLNQVLHGARPADIPVRHPTRFELVINARTAASIGLDVPGNLRLAADRLIE